MTSQRWKQIQDIFQEAADLSESQRSRFLAAACGADSELLREVESLFVFDQPQKAQRMGEISAVIGKTATSLMVAESMTGRRLGAYRITRQLGAGGMGAVYLAVRDDDEYEKQVAVKVGRLGFGGLPSADNAVMRERFRAERQILARLEHPYIGKLLDGGTTADGAPYFIMEYIEGQTIVDYCATHHLSVEKKCELFAKVCEAVAYAHGNLVIHRDLKPSNILVNGDGVPKLLDFGISKLLTPDHGEMTMLTHSVAKLMTPDYASPEQVRGEPFNITTDVYSLGAVLFELLTGQRPHEIHSYSTSEIEDAICTAETRKPSSLVEGLLRRRLNGDLDNIVLMAMRKEPQRRYQSVTELREDILRHLKGLPVRAREESSLYIAGKFLHRHSLGALATAMIFLGLGAGIIGTNYEWRKAEEQRVLAEAQRQTAEQQRRAADSERALADSMQAEAEVQRDVALRAQQQADKRLQQFLGLANESLIKVDEQIASLPGSTQVRKDNVKATLRYLDQLAKESSQTGLSSDRAGDQRIQRLLISGYVSLGEVQGAHGRANLGDSSGALESLHKAETILEPLLRNAPKDEALLKEAVRLYEVQGEILNDQNLHAEGLKQLYRGIGAAERLTALKLGSKEAAGALAEIHHAVTQVLINLDKPAAAVHSAKEMSLFAQLVAAHPNDIKLLNGQVSAFALASEVASDRGRYDESIGYLRKAVAIREGLVERSPNDARLRHDLMMSYGRLADNLGGPYLGQNMGDREGAVVNYRKALTIAQGLAVADAADNMAQSDLATVLSRLGMTLAMTAEHDAEWPESVKMLQQAESITKKLTEADPKKAYEKYLLTTICEYLGHRFEARGRKEEALAKYRESLTLTEALLASDTTSISGRFQAQEDYRALGVLLASMTRRSEALAHGEKAVALAEKLRDLHPDEYAVQRQVPRSYETMGLVYQALARSSAGNAGDLEQARHWFTRARDVWTRFDEIPALRPVDAHVSRMNAKLAECEQALRVKNN